MRCVPIRPVVWPECQSDNAIVGCQDLHCCALLIYPSQSQSSCPTSSPSPYRIIVEQGHPTLDQLISN
uniref:AlNc14C669G12376 protein n=1 Tax=Albugo laibachii Nc14 TaxID=890382 RepID=F0X1R0_9STRA|nr:AlNc14C669G12376 [Albugo laibachii Nc14]|eukprot:CCA27761.1 AlNc14C669G12376 [Albugo laibachii Nc14]